MFSFGIKSTFSRKKSCFGKNCENWLLAYVNFQTVLKIIIFQQQKVSKKTKNQATVREMFLKTYTLK